MLNFIENVRMQSSPVPSRPSARDPEKRGGWIRPVLLAAGLLLAALIVLAAAGRNWIKAVFYIDHMERRERTDVLQVSRVIETLGLTPSQRVADIGAGSGLFTRPMAQAVRPNVTYAVDINPRLLAHVESAAKAAGLDNVRTVLATESDPRLPEPVDLIFLCDTLHYIDAPDQYVLKLTQRLSSTGRVAIVDFYQNWPPMSQEFSPGQLDTWMKRAGCELIEQYGFLPDRYFRIYALRSAL
jgi:cyclopropane fatty-acyl-phospholipid synthase-like methyltransferase